MNLMVQGPNGVWHTHTIPPEGLYIGRGAGNHIVLHDAQASRNHARVWMSQGQYYVQDMGSTNGTFVNEHRIMGTQLLRASDRVRIGSTIIQLASARTVIAPPTGPAYAPVARQAEAPAAVVVPVAPVVQPVAVPTQRRTSGWAIASLIFGLIGFGGILAVIFGHIALNEIDKSGGWIEGKGLAIAGLVLGYLEVAGLCLWAIFFAGLASL